jgi:phage-related protein
MLSRRGANCGRIFVVHGFIKNTEKTPTADLEQARARMQEMKS